MVAIVEMDLARRAGQDASMARMDGKAETDSIVMK
jgi:hypothetical protein